VFCDESYSASPYDLALFVMIYNIILNQLNIKKIKLTNIILKKS
jgi:hypothetical protein